MVSALASLRKGGVVAINAIHLDHMPQFDYDKLLWGERVIRSVANMTRADARDFLKIAHDIGIRPQVTVFPLAQANEALQAIKHRNRGRSCSNCSVNRNGASTYTRVSSAPRCCLPMATLAAIASATCVSDRAA